VAVNGKRTVIAGVATEWAVFAAGVVIRDGRVAARPEPGTETSPGELIDSSGETIYASGEIVATPGSRRYLSCHADYALAPVVA
jgi:hypothetical protein